MALANSVPRRSPGSRSGSVNTNRQLRAMEEDEPATFRSRPSDEPARTVGPEGRRETRESRLGGIRLRQKRADEAAARASMKPMSAKDRRYRMPGRPPTASR